MSYLRFLKAFPVLFVLLAWGSLAAEEIQSLQLSGNLVQEILPWDADSFLSFSDDRIIRRITRDAEILWQTSSNRRLQGLAFIPSKGYVQVPLSSNWILVLNQDGRLVTQRKADENTRLVFLASGRWLAYNGKKREFSLQSPQGNVLWRLGLASISQVKKINLSWDELAEHSQILDSTACIFQDYLILRTEASSNKAYYINEQGFAGLLEFNKPSVTFEPLKDQILKTLKINQTPQDYSLRIEKADQTLEFKSAGRYAYLSYKEYPLFLLSWGDSRWKLHFIKLELAGKKPLEINIDLDQPKTASERAPLSREKRYVESLLLADPGSNGIVLKGLVENLYNKQNFAGRLELYETLCMAAFSNNWEKEAFGINNRALLEAMSLFPSLAMEEFLSKYLPKISNKAERKAFLNFYISLALAPGKNSRDQLFEWYKDLLKQEKPASSSDLLLYKNYFTSITE